MNKKRPPIGRFFLFILYDVYPWGGTQKSFYLIFLILPLLTKNLNKMKKLILLLSVVF